jgi:phosphatidylinositol kinase/protein kinase (PI-3  family)
MQFLVEFHAWNPPSAAYDALPSAVEELMTPMNVFVTEGNVEIYLSKLHNSLDQAERDTLLRLVAQEESLMGWHREHLDASERRLGQCRERVQKQQETVAELERIECDTASAKFMLATFERLVALMQDHHEHQRAAFARAKL